MEALGDEAAAWERLDSTFFELDPLPRSATYVRENAATLNLPPRL